MSGLEVTSEFSMTSSVPFAVERAPPVGACPPEWISDYTYKGLFARMTYVNSHIQAPMPRSVPSVRVRLGASDEILRVFLQTWNGMIRQYSEAKTTDVPAGRDGMYFKEYSAQADWMHHGEGLQLFHRMNLSLGADERYADRARRFAGFYMGTDPAAPNYDPSLRLIRSMLNGSRGPMLRPATALDWVGDPFDVSLFVAGHDAWPFVLCGALKIAYDLALLWTFRHVKPPEEN